MIHCINNKKYCIDPKEDTKTSSIFGDLLHLPSELCWELIRNSCTDKIYLPKISGEIIEYEFWPHWVALGTSNKNIVEPDVFIRFEEFDLIIEAKREDETGQYEDQWNNEIKSYFNSYPDYNKKVIMIAIGGSRNMSKQELTVINLEENKNIIVPVFKCNWLSVLIETTALLEEINIIKYRDSNRESLKRILQDIIIGFNIHNMFYLKWLDTLNKDNFEINEKSIELFTANFQIYNV